MKFHKKVLKNGLRIITVPMKDNQTVTVMVLVEAGSSYEHKKINGISHFLEHMCFKGTEKRPTANIIHSEFDRIGSESNAFTSNEYTGYYAKSHAKHLPKILDLVSDVYLNSTLPQEEMAKEKGVVIEEINMYEDMPQHKVEDVLEELLYGNQPAGFSIAGPRKNIQKLKREELIRYRKDHYVAESTVVVVAGHFDEKKLGRDIEKHFLGIPKSKKKSKLKTKVSQKSPAVKIHYKKTDQTHLRLAFRAYDLYSEKYWASMLLATILGSGMSSRLFQKMREELGICYYISASNRAYTDHGQFVISVGASDKRAEEAIGAILIEMKKMVTESVGEAELQKAKDYRIGHLFLGLESSDDFTEFYGFQEIYHQKILSPAECEEKVRKVTARDVQKVAKEIFKNEKMNLAIVGPFHNSKKFLSLLRM